MERRAPNNQMDKSSQGRLDWKNTKDWGIDLLPEMDSLPLVSTFAKQFFNLESPSRSSPCLPLWFHHIWFTYSLLSNIYFPLAFFSPKKHRLFTLLRYNWYIISSVQSLSRVRLFATPWIAACQASLSITNSRILLKLMSIESVMPSSHLILCCPLLLLSLIPPSIRVFSSESTLCMRWPKYWSFSFSISPSNEHPGLISFRMDWLDL